MPPVETTTINPVTSSDPAPVTTIELPPTAVEEAPEPAIDDTAPQIDNNTDPAPEPKEPIEGEVAEDPEGDEPNPKDFEKNVEEKKAKDEEQSSARFAALAKREKQVVEMERTIKESEEKIKYFNENFERITNSPKALIEELGYKDLNSFVTAALDEMDGKEVQKTPEQLMKEMEAKNEERWNKLETEKEEQQRLQKEAQEAHSQKIIEKAKKDITEFVSTGDNLQKYELINAYSTFDSIYEAIEAEHEESGRIMSIEEAADRVEEIIEAEVKKAMGTSKVKSLIGEPKPTKKSMSLSNKSVSGAGTAAKEYEPLLSKEESMKRAAAKLRHK